MTRFPLWGPAALLAVVLLAGCTGGDRPQYASELDEPSYREGQSLLKSGHRAEALSAFLRVIERRGDDAPESHLEAGMLYLQQVNDPLAAIYHFKKYIAIRPNSPQAPLIRQRIDAAIREFARTLPAQPIPTQGERIDLIAKVDRLQRENESLKQQLADLKGGRIPDEAKEERPAPSPGSAFSVKVDNVLPVVRTSPAPTPRQPVVTPPATAVPGETRPAPASSGKGRTHTVKAGDTLYKLAQQYYGDRARWKEIYSANRGAMKSETDLRAGMTLKIP